MCVCVYVCVFNTVGWEGLTIPLAEILMVNVVDLT